jgi:hypothetical protein
MLEELAAAAHGDDVTGGRGLLAELKADAWSWLTCSPAGGEARSSTCAGATWT